jgi:flagellar protein FlbD
MIRLTRLNHQPIVVNAELIEYLEATPDTVISLVHGQKLTVLETLDEVMGQIIEYQRFIRQKPIVQNREELSDCGENAR